MPARSRPGCDKSEGRGSTSGLVGVGAVEVGQLALSTILQPCALRPVASRQVRPRRRLEAVCDRPGGAGHLQFADSRVERVVGSDRARIPCPRAAAPFRYCRLCRRSAARHPGKGQTHRHRPLDHRPGHPGLVLKVVASGTWSAANWAGSAIQVLGRYKALSMKAWQCREA